MKSISKKELRVTILVLFCVVLSSCNSKKKSADLSTSKPPASFAQSLFLDITPMMDGSAYAKSLDSGLWYLRGDKAVRVTCAGDASQKLPAFSEITAVLDGSAYATSWEQESGLWHLQGEHAEKVNEVPSLANSDILQKVPDKAFYALYLSEHKKRIGAEYRADNPADFAPDPPEEDPY